jgi:hypothetical protein
MPKKASAPPPPDKAPTDYERGFERCVVTFIDILGYKHLLKTRHAKDIAKVVNALRSFTAGDADEEDTPKSSDEVRLYTQSFSESVSDAVVRVRTVDTQSKDGPFAYELIDLALAIVECVNQGILIRGGMTIGPVHVGLDGQGPIFGNGMVRAYEIEENEAVYPRIMIDDEALQAYLSDKSLWQDGEFNPHEARLSVQYLGVADDGSHFVDYLRAADAGEFDDGVAGQFTFLARHRKLIVDGLKSTDAKVRRKLVWLANYHNRFVAELRVKYDMNDPNGAFYDEIGTSPPKLFDSLMIEQSWTNVISRLNDLAGDVEL